MIIEEPSCFDTAKTEVWNSAAQPPVWHANDSDRFLVVVRDRVSGAGELLIGYYTKLRDGRNVWLLEDDGQWSQDCVTHWRRLPTLPGR